MPDIMIPYFVQNPQQGAGSRAGRGEKQPRTDENGARDIEDGERAESRGLEYNECGADFANRPRSCAAQQPPKQDSGLD